MDVVVLAGGKSPESLRLATGCAMRAELPFRGKRILDLVVAALREATPEGTAVTVVGANAEGCEGRPAGSTFLESIYLGLEAGNERNVLLSTADLPFLTTESVLDFLSRADFEAALNWPIVPVEICEQQFPNLKRTNLKLREGRFTGGNIALVNREKFQKIFPKIEKAYRSRKSPLKLATQIGISTLLRVLIGQLLPSTLAISALERKVSASVGEPVRAIVSNYAELGSDIDNLEQYQAIVQAATS